MMTPSVQVPSTSIPSTASSIDQLKQELQNAVSNVRIPILELNYAFYSQKYVKKIRRF